MMRRIHCGMPTCLAFVVAVQLGLFAGPFCADDGFTFVSKACALQSDPPELPMRPGSPKASLEGNSLRLDFINMKTADGWIIDPENSQRDRRPALILLLTDRLDQKDPPKAYISRFPVMRGMDNQVIERWVGQVQLDDGKKASRNNAKITEEKIGDIQLTIMDIQGTVLGHGAHTKAGLPNHRFIGAIIDLPRGPYFIRVVGKISDIKKNEDKIMAFLKSAKPN